MKTILLLTMVAFGGCGKKEKSGSASETTAAQTEEETTEENAASEETTPTVELPTLPNLDLHGAIALAIAGTSSGAKLNLTAGSESNLRRINADGTDGPALSDTDLVTQQVIVGRNDDIYVVFEGDPENITPPVGGDFTRIGRAATPPPPEPAPEPAQPAPEPPPALRLGGPVWDASKKYAS
jgi:hypothetical protein